MINNLQWESLESRRVKSDLTMLYKCQSKLVSIPDEYHPSRASMSTRCNHNQKLFLERANTEIYRNSLFIRSVPVWNGLPAVVVEQSSIDNFKTQLKLVSI